MPDDFDDLMARLRAGDDAAAAEVFHRFAGRLVGLARTRLDGLLRGKIDPEDILQSVYRSFFTQHAEGRFALDSWDGLWGLLARIAVRKCDHRRRHFRSAGRDVAREAAPAEDGPFVEALARDPTPSEAARLTETVERLLRELDSRDQEILSLCLQGSDVADISARVGRTERTVQRILKRVRERLEAWHAEGSPTLPSGDGEG